MRRLIAGFVVTIVFVAILLISAGRADYWQAWAYGVISAAMNFCTYVILKRNPQVAAERAKIGEGSKTWDKVLLGLGLLLTLITLVLAGLDCGRFHSGAQLPSGSFVFGAVLTILGAAMFLSAMNENRFFSAAVRIQAERGHSVCSSGLYRIVRHPGYSGMIVGTIGLPLLLASAWSCIPAFLSVLLLIVRTRLEDRTLAEELPGYRGYQQSTPYRLMPGVW
ncbi:isoprenylcysteine carboxyl methyltransferase [Opitutaceae bacterium EW11]|nr:isoprenylcysteine carboxyl methyltransferase [Opitutaceae bacterium EW11]